MSYANRKQMSSNRTAAIIIVALIHIALGYALVTGLAYNVIKQTAEKMKTFDVEDEPPPPEEEPPPPPEKTEVPPPPQVVAPPPIVRTNVAPPPIVSTPVAPPPVITPRASPAPPAPPAPPPPRISQAARAKANLSSLFSTDDYPQSAIRNEEQGTTSVRLTVSTDGPLTWAQIGQRAVLRVRQHWTVPPATSFDAGRVTPQQRIRRAIPSRARTPPAFVGNFPKTKF